MQIESARRQKLARRQIMTAYSYLSSYIGKYSETDYSVKNFI